MARGGAGQFLEQRRAIVRRHLVQNPDDLFVRHRAEQLLLRLDVEIFENVGGLIVRQDAEDDDLFVFGKISDAFCDIGGRPIGKELA